MTISSNVWSLAFGTLPLSEGLRMLDAQEVRYFNGADPARFRKLCTMADLDAFLASDTARAPRVALADGRQWAAVFAEEEHFTFGDDGQIDLTKLLTFYDAGATVVIRQMHDQIPALARFCRGLERVFLHPVQCNIYLTPPGAQGFRTHYDTHDVLVLQVEGEKLWRTWPTPYVPFASLSTPFDGEPPKTTEEPQSRMLRAGDVLFVPRGVLHDAASHGERSSLHLTIGIMTHTWADALRSALDVMERENPSLRQPFPTWRLADGSVSDDLVRQAQARLSALGTMSSIELMSQDLLSKLASDRPAMLSRGLSVPAVSRTDRITLADTVHYFVLPRVGGGAELRWAGGVIPLSAQEFGWIARIAEGTSPGALGEESLAFCQKLASAGLVTVEPAAALKAAE